ncbi:MAG: type II toxin-antitoxin system VapC family toxin [Nitrospirae bacterium]|nr:type II toxin-antitoxin system VapC family toxin [Nitrospirota bacterium]
MLLVLDSNEYIFAFGILKKPFSIRLIDIILDTFPTYSIRIPRLIVEEVGRHLTPEEFREFIEFITNLTTIDEDFVVPFELGAKYELDGLKPADAFIAAYTEWTGADILVTENRHFLRHHSSLPFKILNAEECLRFIQSSK